MPGGSGRASRVTSCCPGWSPGCLLCHSYDSCSFGFTSTGWASFLILWNCLLKGEMLSVLFIFLVYLGTKEIPWSFLLRKNCQNCLILWNSAVEQENSLSWCFYFPARCFVVVFRVYIWLNFLWLLKAESPKLCFICKVLAAKARVKQCWKNLRLCKTTCQVSKVKGMKTGHKSLCLQKTKSPEFIIYAALWFAHEEAPCWDKCCNYSDNTLGAAASSVGHSQESTTASSCCASRQEGEHLAHSNFFFMGNYT